MGANRYDVVIVGARVAGSMAAAMLGRAGLSILLVDRARLPKPTLSCPIYFANTLDFLDRFGLVERVQGLGAPELHTYLWYLGPLSLRGQMLPYHGRTGAFSLRRELFDQVLLEHASAQPNVEVQLGLNVIGLLRDSTGRVIGIRGHGEGGKEKEIRADLVVGADGVFSIVAGQVGARRYNVRPARTCVYYAYYEGIKPADDGPNATVYAEPKIPATFITSDASHGETVLSISLPASSFEDARREPDNLHARLPRLVPRLFERMSAARRATPVYGVSPRESFYRVPFGPGWVLIGDAGYYKDPITGQGIHDALRSAELFVEAFLAYRRGAKWDPVMRRAQATRDLETRSLYDFTDYFAQVDRVLSPNELELFRAISEMPHWSDRLVSVFNGVTDASVFRKRDSLVRILAEWRVRQFLQRLTGRRALRSSEAGT